MSEIDFGIFGSCCFRGKNGDRFKKLDVDSNAPKNSKRCRGCGEFFVPQKASDKICGECRELLAVGDTKDVLEFERLRSRYNTRHLVNITYGQFEQHIARLRRAVKSEETR